MIEILVQVAVLAVSAAALLIARRALRHEEGHCGEIGDLQSRLHDLDPVRFPYPPASAPLDDLLGGDR